MKKATGVRFVAEGNTLIKKGAFKDATVGQWILITGASHKANNGYKKILTCTNDMMTVSSAENFVNEKAKDVVTVRFSLLVPADCEPFKVERPKNMKTAKDRWYSFRDKHDVEGDFPVNDNKLRHEHLLQEIDALYEIIQVLDSRITELENADK